MKCDELKSIKADTYGDVEMVYLKSDVDAAIDELKTEHHRERHEYIEMVEQLRQENAELKQKLKDHCIHCPVKEQEDDVVAELKKKLESVQASMYADVVDVNMENRRIRRALWLARANRALEKIAWFKLWNTSISTMNPEDGTRQEYDKWKKNLGKFIKKEEEYK